MPKEKQFFISSECGGEAVWSLHNPVQPEYGHWGWAIISPYGRVEFIRQMTPSEITFIRLRYMVWGDKLHSQPWARVVGYEGGSSIGIAAINCDPTGGVGV